MDEQNDAQDISRIPQIEDLLNLCKHLNDHGVEYVIIGGFAVIHHGYIRGTSDIDLLVSKERENVERIKRALSYLADNAVQDVQPGDLAEYTVIRVADEVVIDLMAEACGRSYEDLKSSIEPESMNGVSIPYLSVQGLLSTKQGVRPKDIQDRQYLERLLRSDKKK